MTTLPATFLEAEAITTIVVWIDRVAEKLTSEWGRQWLRADIRDRIRQGTIPTMQVIAAAREGDMICDHALRELLAEMLDRREAIPTALLAYMQEALLQPPLGNPKGRNFLDTWTRDVGIAVLVQMTSERFGVSATRSHLSKNPGRMSACHLVAQALGQRGHNLTERRVEKIYTERSRMAARLAPALPAI